ncbi:MAG: hypothetical protein WBP26_04110 [Candidatus Saccharimonadales bacterium]
MTKDTSNNEPQNTQSLPGHDDLGIWAPEFGKPGNETLQPVAQTVGPIAAGNARWDRPERPLVPEEGAFPEEEIKRVTDVRRMMLWATAPSGTAGAEGTLQPAAAQRYLNNHLGAVEYELGESRVSKRMAMIVGTLVSANPLGRLGGEESARALKLIDSGAFHPGQLNVLRGIRGEMMGALNQGPETINDQLKQIDIKLYGDGGETKGLLPRIGEPAAQRNANLAAFWLAYAAGLAENPADSARRFRNLTDFMRTGVRGRDYMQVE